MWFNDAANSREYGRTELSKFVNGTSDFLKFVLENHDDLSFMWEGREQLLPLAYETFRLDVVPMFVRVEGFVGDIHEEALEEHGLKGRPLQFKLRMLDALAQELFRFFTRLKRRWRPFKWIEEYRIWPQRLWNWGKVRKQLKVREWLKKVFEAVDAILDSILNALPNPIGQGNKEYKDMLSAAA